jgi:hypothetical protein
MGKGFVEIKRGWRENLKGFPGAGNRQFQACRALATSHEIHPAPAKRERIASPQEPEANAWARLARGRADGYL